MVSKIIQKQFSSAGQDKFRGRKKSTNLMLHLTHKGTKAQKACPRSQSSDWPTGLRSPWPFSLTPLLPYWYSAQTPERDQIFPVLRNHSGHHHSDSTYLINTDSWTRKPLAV